MINLLTALIISNALVVISNRYCFKHEEKITIINFIPIVNYGYLLGKNKLMVLILSFLVSYFTLLNLPHNYYGLFLLITISVLIVLSIIDYWMYIVSFEFLLILSCLSIYKVILYSHLTIFDHFFGVFIYSCFMILVNLIKNNSFGRGDIKLVAILGLFFGLDGIISILFSSIIIGGIIGLFYIKSKIKIIPFVPAICLSSILVLTNHNYI